MKAAISMDMLKHDLRLQKANDFVVAQAVVGEASKKEEAPRRRLRSPSAPARRPLRRVPRARRSPSAPARTKTEESAEEPKAE